MDQRELDMYLDGMTGIEDLAGDFTEGEEDAMFTTILNELFPHTINMDYNG